MRWVMKQGDALTVHASKERAGRRARSSMKRWVVVRSARGRRAALAVHAAPFVRVASHSVPLPWEAAANAIPSGVSTAWCGDAVTLRAAIEAAVPFIVVPRGAEGTALLDAVAAKLGTCVSLTRIGAAARTLSTSQALAAAIAEGEGGAAGVARVLAERGQGVDHLLVGIDEAGRLSPEALAFLQRLTEIRTPGSPAVQVAFVGGPPFFMSLADERFQSIREEVRSESGGDFEYDPNTPEVARLTGSQRAGLAAGLLTVFSLMIGPLVPWAALPSLGWHAASASQVAQAPATPSPNPAVLAVAVMAPVENPAVILARQRQEFDTALAARGPNARRLSQAERDRLFRSYLARQQGPVFSPGVRLADRHV